MNKKIKPRNLPYLKEISVYTVCIFRLHNYAEKLKVKFDDKIEDKK